MSESSRRYLLNFLLVFMGYFVAARLGMWSTSVTEYASLIWPAAGVAVASMILCGIRIWPAILLSHFLLLVSMRLTEPGVLIVGPIAPVIGAAVGVWSLRRWFNFNPDFTGTRHVFTFIAIGAALPSLLSALLGVTGRAVVGATTSQRFADELMTWWLGDAIGILLTAPLILVWTNPAGLRQRFGSRRLAAEMMVATTLLFATAGLAFLNQYDAYEIERHLAYLPVPVLIWLAMRFATPGATFGVFLLATIACVGTVQGSGPFGDPNDAVGLPMLWSYMAILSMSFLTMASVVEERRQYVNALQSSEEQHRRIIETAKEGIWVIDADGMTTFANNRMGEILGYRVDELIGHSMYEFMNEEARAEAEINLERRRRGIQEQHEFCFRHREGRDVWTLLATNPLVDEHGVMQGALAMVSDITDRKQVESAIERLAERVSSVTDDSFFESLVLNLAEAARVDFAFVGLLHDDAEQARTLAVCRQGQLIGNFSYNLKSTPCANVLEEQLCMYASGVGEKFADDRLVREFGIESYAGIPLTDSKGARFGLLVCMHTDKMPDPKLTGHLLRIFGMRCAAELERKRAEQSLVESEERYRTLVNAAPIPILVHVDEKIAFVNRAAAEVLGAESTDQLLGVSIWDILHPDSYDVVRERLAYVEQGHRLVPIVPERFVRLDGTPIDVEVMASRTTYFGRPAMQAVFRNVSERLKAENALRESERRNRSIVSALTEGITLYDTSGQLIAHNESALRILELEYSELGRRSIFEADWEVLRADGRIFKPEELPACITLRHGRPMDDVLMGIRRPNGDVRWLSTNTQPIYGEDEQTPVAVVVSFSDITAQREAVEVLEFQREVLNLIARGAEMRQILDRLCLQLERTIANSKCCAATTDDNFEGPSVIASPSLPNDLSAVIRDTLLRGTEEPCLRAMRGGSDVLSTEKTEPAEAQARLRELASRCGHESCWLVSVRSEGDEMCGLLAVLHDEARSPTGFESQILRTAADLAGIAIERHRALSALRDSEERFRSLAESIPGAVYLCHNDENYSAFYFNDAIQLLTGYPADDFVNGKIHYAELIHPDDLAEVRRLVNLAVDQKRSFELSYRIHHRDDSWRWIHEIGVGVFRDGQLAFLEGFLHDVTEFRRSERELAQANQMLQIVLDTIPVRVFWKDLQLHYLGCNRVFAADAAISDPDEIVGRSDHDLSWREQADLYRADDRRVIENETPVLNYEEPQTTPSGEKIWLKTSKVPLRDVDGEVIGVLGTYEDITDQKRIEVALRESEERYRTMVEHAPEAIVVYDMEARRFVDVNDNACAMFKCDRQTLLARSPFDLTPSVKIDGRPAKQIARERLQEAINGEAPVFEYVHCDIEGNSFPCEIRLVRMPPYSKKLIRGSLTDITERKEVERRQAFLMDELDHRVKNNLAAVLALTSQTLATCRSLADFGPIFTGRVEALTRTHELLAASRWRGVNLQNLVRMVLEPLMLPDRKGIEFGGPDVMLPARASGPLAMTLHELMTNSLKHGSLCEPGGRLNVDWSIAPDQVLSVRWVESDGPSVCEPERTGLGVRLIRGFIEHELGGETKLEFNPAGLVCLISIPLGGHSKTESDHAASRIRKSAP